MQPVFTKTFGLISGAIVTSIFSISFLGSHYGSPITQHLIDIVNGNQTQTVDSENAPNWGQGIPLPAVGLAAIATTSAGTSALASSTAYSFAVSAGDDNNQTVLSDIKTTATNASSTLLPDENILVTWGSIAGAQNYRLWFATGTASSASQFNQYFNASTSRSFNFSTSSGSITGTPNTDSKAFSTLIRPNGTSFVDGNNGTATTTSASTTALHINGNVDAISVGTTSACYALTAGQVFYNTQNAHEWGCNGSAWQKIF
jgi:hypothetical protein